MGRVNIVTGQAQTGKTTLALRLVEAPRVLILDPVRSRPITSEISSGRTQSFGTWMALSSFLASEAANGKWRVALRSQDDADYIMALKCAPYYRHVTMLVDEGFWFCSQKDLLTPLIKCARANSHYGGGVGMPLWITVQRPNDLPPDIRSQADQVVSFLQEEPTDLDYLSKRFSPAFAECVVGLRGHRWAASPPLSKGVHCGTDDEGGTRGSGGSVDRSRRVSGRPGDQPEHHREAAHPEGGGVTPTGDDSPESEA